MGILNQINRKNLTPKLKQHYEILRKYLLYLLGKIENPKLKEEKLLKHIEYHKNQNDRATKGCFFENLDLRELVDMARNRIETINPNHFEMSDMYRFRLGTPIGYKGEDITKDLCVVTALGSKDIITMFPVILSDKFDNEEMSTSEELRRKRQRAICVERK